MTAKPIKLSVLDLVPVFDEVDATFALGQAVELAQAAERLGYFRYWVAEHHDMPGLACTSTDVLLSHIGAKTHNIRIGSGALLLPHYKPLKVAESFHLLASLYPGRVDLGLGRAPGGSAEVSLALSDNFLENVWKMPELLRGVSDFLQGSYEYEGRRITARPTPPVSPELWLLGTNKKSAAYAAEFGTGYVFGQFMSEVTGEEVLRAYREAFTPSALSPVPRAIVAVGVVCAETEEEAERLASSGTALFQQEASAGERAPLSERKLLIGTPESLKKKLEQLSHLYGVDEFIVVTMIPDYRKRLRSFELLARTCLMA
ncbi:MULTISPECIES: LLM class flavin-dependent oxidoreductase [unclassified Paenibacillus]|uniref:LLM class flavin-dependent oxidoreductase n=1 Tax=unclassified Paenibacillus TaxID=185978 RepID=UPI002405F0EB|nr:MULTISPECIES: LLM class flavin-dependent oxidoreductase [unclassified Paenibacillus]MDF9841268.1 luciferase family oxidoreductase group 1 [Paenibacillus sp. PastF-2]MDF9847859.1 luciferase family oxidoreductase group 1 [Paenibacillus sp. PastM-2]MDF9854427.1 luciferase family oxidoreductase group 1 [Paenibacillus sp. PastF-1]MDH6479964.1 luciferase family oxidoreductase group 1 [Paenibacillus sp. PastH-2]MDH6507134.1 luciferase family oxidoreductase group 1 [Paenibacillus sp. PastM-3]